MTDMNGIEDVGMEDFPALNNLVLTKLCQFSFPGSSEVTRVCVSPDSQILAVTISSAENKELFLLYHPLSDPSTCSTPSFDSPAHLESLSVCKVSSHLWLTPSDPNSWCRDRNILVVLTAADSDASLLWIEVSVDREQGLKLLTLSSLSIPDLRTLISEDTRSLPVLSTHPTSLEQLSIKLYHCKHDQVLLVADPIFILLVSIYFGEQTQVESFPCSLSPVISTLLPLQPSLDRSLPSTPLDMTSNPSHTLGYLRGVNIRGPILLSLYSNGFILLHRIPSGGVIGTITISEYLQCCVSEETDPGESDCLSPPYTSFSTHPHVEYIAVANEANYVILIYLRRYIALFPSHLYLSLITQTHHTVIAGQDTPTPAPSQLEEDLLKISQTRPNGFSSDSPLWNRRLRQLKTRHIDPLPQTSRSESRSSPAYQHSSPRPEEPLADRSSQPSTDNPFSSNFTDDIPSPSCDGCTWFSSPVSVDHLRVQSISCQSELLTLHYSEDDVSISHICVFNLQTGERCSSELSHSSLPIHTHSHTSEKLLLLLQDGWGVCPVVGLSRQYLLAGVLAHCDASAAEMLCQNNGWQQSLLPVSVLKESLAHRQLDSVCFYLRMRRTREGELELVSGTEGEGKNGLPMPLDSIRQSIDTLYGNLRGSTKDSYEAQFSSQVLHLSHKFILFLLMRFSDDSTQDHADINADYIASELAKLRQFMQVDMVTPGVCEKYEFVHQGKRESDVTEGLDPPTPAEWRHMRKSDIIRDALDKQCLPLAQSYLHSRLEEQVQSQGGSDKTSQDLRYKPSDISWKGIRQLVLHLAYQCLGREDLSTCEQRLAVVGPSVPGMLHYLATHTTSRFVRSSLLNELKASGTLTEEELDLFEFIQVLEHTYPSSSYKQSLNYVNKCYKSSKPASFPEYPTFRDMPPPSSLTGVFQKGELDELCPEFFGSNKPLLSSQSAGKRDSHYFTGSFMWFRGEDVHNRDILLMEGFFLRNDHHSQQCSHLLSPRTLIYLYTSLQLGLNAANQVSTLVKESQLFTADSLNVLLREMKRTTHSTRCLVSTALTSSGIAPPPPADMSQLIARVFQEVSQAHILFSQSPSLKLAEETIDGFLSVLTNFAAAEGCASFLSISLDDLNSSYPLSISRFVTRITNDQDDELKFPVWIRMLALSKQLSSTKTEFNVFMFQYSIYNARYLLEQPNLKLTDTFHQFKPLIPLATLIYAPVPLEETIGGSAEYSIPKEVFFQAIQPYPKLLNALFPSEAGSPAFTAPFKEVTVYELLHGSVPFNLQQLFSWQSTNRLRERFEIEHSRKNSTGLYRGFPHFSSEEFSQTYGYTQKLDYIHYLNKGNPTFAYANLLAADPKIESKYCSNRMKSVCQRVYRLGLSHYNIPKVTSSCAAFMEMLGWDSTPFRTDIVLLNLLLQYDAQAVLIKKHALALQYSLAHSNSSPSQEGFLALSRYAEDLFRGFMTSGDISLDNFTAAEVWAVLENFCHYHDLPPTRSYLEKCASSDHWPQLLSYAQMWSSPPKLLLEIIREHFQDSDIKEHLETAILVMIEQQAKRKVSHKMNTRLFPASSASSEGKVYKKSLSRERPLTPDKKEDTPVEVFELLPIDRSSRLNRSDNLFELICASQTSPYPTARTLLAFAVSLRRDILPLLANCFITQCESGEDSGQTPPPFQATQRETATILDCLCVWIFCKLYSAPELKKAIISLDIIKRDNVPTTPLYLSNHLQWHQWELKDLEQVCVCLSSNMPAYGIIIKQAFRFFDFENPYVHFLRFVETYALHSFDQSQKQLENFLICMKKLCSGEQQYPKSSLGSPKWVSDLSSLCLLQMLAHPITPWHHISLLTTVIKALERVQQPYKLPKDSTFDPALHTGFTGYPMPLGDLLNTQRLTQILSIMQPMEKVPIEITCRSTVPILPEVPTSSWLNSLTQALTTSLPHGELLSQLAELGVTEVVEQICDIVHLYPTKAILKSFELRYQRLLKSSWWNSLDNRIDFWQNCNATLQSIRGDINLIAEFFERIASNFHGEGEEISSGNSIFSDAILLRQLALDWHLKYLEQDPVKISSLRKMVWLSRLEWITSGTEPSVCLAHILKTTSRNPDVIGFYDLTQLTLSPPLDPLLTPQESPELNQDLRDALSLIFGLLLDTNLVGTALELASLFKHRPPNIVIVCTCIGLAQRNIECKHIDPTLLALINVGDTIDDKSELTSSLVDNRSTEYIQLFRALLEQGRTPGLTGGSRCLDRIQSLYQVSQGLVMGYTTTANEATRTSLLTILTSEEIGHKLQLAIPFVRSCCVDTSRLASFLERCIYITLCRHFGHSYEMNLDDPVIVRPVFDVDSKSDAFSELTRICNEAELGRLLLQHASKDVQIAQASKAEPKIALLQVCIELLIRAETCLSNATQLDQISNLINATLALAKVLTLRQFWSMLARLLTGIGRFHELSDILEIFVNHEQLEYLLKKGLDKEELLKTALLKFLVKHHENDIDKLTIVAMRFNLYRGLGETCVKQAKLQLRKLIHDYPKLEDFPDVKERVREVCKLFCNAATYYSREDCYMQASECKQQARLMCAQYKLLPYNIIVVSTSKMAIRALLATPNKHLLFPETLIIADAYSLNNPKSWGDILYGRCVRNKSISFFSSYTSKFPFDSQVYKHMVNRLTTENPRNIDYRDNLVNILNTIPDMTVEHNLLSELTGAAPSPVKLQHSLSQEIISELQNL